VIYWELKTWALHEGGPTAGPLGQGELLVANSSPHSYRARRPADAAMMTLRQRGEATMKTTPTCRSSPPPRWQRRRSTTALATGLHRRRHTLPRLPPLDAVVVSITLGDLAFFVLRLACSALPLRCRLVPVENRLLRKRRLGQNKVGTLQLQRQEGIKVNRRRRPPRRSASQQKRTRCIEKITTHNFFVPAWGSIGSSRDGGHEYIDLPIACATRRWTSSGDGRDGAVTVPA
jgi:hypothetical protein